MDKVENNKTLCYSYEVTMVVQVLAESREQSMLKLDKEGGYVSKRNVVLKDVVSIYEENQ
jgi:hypothetical protein